MALERMVLMKQIVLIVGSLRKDSFNKQLAYTIQNKLQNQANVDTLDYQNIPYMNEDIEFPTPTSIQHIRQIIKQADGLWIISPEYNYEIPGVLKNLLDWLSRPEIQNDWETGSVLKNKPVTISSVAGKSQGLGVRTSLANLLQRLEMNVIQSIGTGFSFTPETFVTQTLELSKDDQKVLDIQIQTFLETIKNG